MTIENDPVFNAYVGNSAATTFVLEASVYDAGDVEVWLETISTGSRSQLTLGVDYSITVAAGNENATVTYPLAGAPMSSAYRLILIRSTAEEQLVDFANQSGFLPEVLEEALDKLEAQIQELSARINASVRGRVDETVNFRVPPVASRGGKVLGFNESGAVQVFDVPTSVVETGTPAITPFQYGAIGDGVADDTQAITDWIADVEANTPNGDLAGPRAIYDLGGGDFAISAPITFSSAFNSSILRNGTLRPYGTWTPTDYLVTFSSAYGDVQNVNLWCDDKCNGLKIDAGRVRVHEVQIFRMTQVGLWKPQGSGGDMRVSNCLIGQFRSTDAAFANQANFTATGILIEESDCKVADTTVRWCLICYKATRGVQDVMDCHFFNGAAAAYVRTNAILLEWNVQDAPEAGELTLNNVYLDNGECRFYQDRVNLIGCRVLLDAADASVQAFFRFYSTGQANPRVTISDLTFAEWDDTAQLIGFPATATTWPEDYANLREELARILVAAQDVRINGGYQSYDIDVLNAIVRETTPQPIVVLAMGQSNMRINADADSGDKTEDPQVFLWNADLTDNDNYVDGTRFRKGEFGQAPLNIAGTTQPWANSLYFSFAKELRKRTGRPVYVVPIAAGSHAIEAFITDAGLTANGWTRDVSDQDLTAHIYPGALTALAEVPNNPQFYDYLIWHQGEANSTDGVEDYAAKLETMIAELDAAGVINDDRTKVVAGELVYDASNSHWFRHSNALKRAALDVFALRIAESSGLSRVSATNTLHFSGTSIVDFGKRYVDAALSKQDRPNLFNAPLELGTDVGFLHLCQVPRADEEHFADRQPVSVFSTVASYANTAELGDCFSAPANSNMILCTRNRWRVPVNGLITVEYELVAAGDGIDHGATVYQFNKNLGFISAITFNPLSSPANIVDGVVQVSVTFGRTGLGADQSLSATCEWVAPGVFIGAGADDPAFHFNIIDIRIG